MFRESWQEILQTKKKVALELLNVTVEIHDIVHLRFIGYFLLSSL